MTGHQESLLNAAGLLEEAASRVDKALMRYALRRDGTLSEGEKIAALRWRLRDATREVTSIALDIAARGRWEARK